MTLRAIVMVAGLATLVGGCSTPSEPRHHDDRGYPYDHRVYRDTDSYQGYYYVRIIYISGTPWYVDDYRRVRPIPRHLHSHFQHSTWVRSLPPRFGRDREVRDGYDVSRIVYINNVPHYVDDDRRARAVPDRVRSRFDYQVVVPRQGDGRRDDDRRGDDRQGDGRRGDDRRGDDRPQPPQRYDDRESRPAPPAYGRDRQVTPAQERERERQVKPVNERERERESSPESRTETTPRRTETQESMREERDRRAPPVARDGRNAQDKSRKGDEQRTDTAAERKNGNAQGRGKDRGEDEREAERDWRTRGE